MKHNKWVSVWGNAVSIAENRPERYAKDITIRYPIHIPFDSSAIRLTFDNYCGTEPVTLTKTTVFHQGKFYPVAFGGQRSVTIPAEGTVESDPLPIEVELIEAAGRNQQLPLCRLGQPEALPEIGRRYMIFQIIESHSRPDEMVRKRNAICFNKHYEPSSIFLSL